MWNRLRNLYRSPFGYGLAGGVFLWASLPPLEWNSLAWVAPIWWILLIRKSELPGRRPYAQLWCAGFLFWMAELHFLRLPHPATSLGWVALSLYLAFYLPVFVACSRVAVHQLRLPVILVAPVVWTGLELARGHLLTGFTMASLGHSQYQLIWLIQFAQLFGAYGVSFVVMFIAACLARMWPLDEAGEENRRFVFWPTIPIGVVLPALYWYGMVHQVPESGEKPVRIAIIQGSIDTEFKSDPAMAQRILDHYFELSREAVKEFAPVDLVVWPETMFRTTLTTFDENAAVPANCPWTREEFLDYAERAADTSAKSVQNAVDALDTPMLIGIDRCHHGADGAYFFNSAVLATPDDGVTDTYDKMHLVLFGEYVPLGKKFPFLQRLTPLPISLDAGRNPVSFEFKGIRLSPSICYENVLPQVIRRQFLGGKKGGRYPDVLVTLTNDGWFWGSSALDLHLICGVFRAVETQRPMIIAANTGFSAWIGPNGRILAKGPRQETGYLLAEIAPADRGVTFYTRYGDWASGLCLLATIGFAVVGIAKRLSRRRKREKAKTAE